MYRDDSPDYSAPMRRRFSPPPARDLSPVYSPPRHSRSPSRDQQGRSTSRRSRSPRDREHRKRSRSPYWRPKKERSFSPVASYVSDEDEEILRSLHCRRCAVTLHDRDSMMAHIKVRADFWLHRAAFELTTLCHSVSVSECPYVIYFQ